MPSRRPGLVLAGLLLLSLAIGVAERSPVDAAPGTGDLPLPARFVQTAAENEIDDLVVVPIDADWDGSHLLRSRPLILDWNTNPAFAIRVNGPMMGETQARDELAAFLTMRGLGEMNVRAVLDRYDDPDIMSIVQAPPLRAALLMLSGLEPYQAVINSLIGGENDTGLPFASVEFADLGIANAVATIRPPGPETGGRFLMQISAAFAGEPPLQLLPALIHESLHGDGENSGPEELAANILDTIAYGELLLIDPSAAYDGTQLTAYNNLQLYALLNSMGARGGGQIGINTSVNGDVFIGPGLEAFDARSIRASILQDPFYGALGASASAISPVAAALLERMPGASSLGDQPHFDEALLALIDRGASEVITPDAALSLALTLGLQANEGSSEVAFKLRPATLLDLQSRPFMPSQIELFDLNQSHRPPNTTDARTMRLALSEALVSHASTGALRSASLMLFDDDRIEAAYPHAQIRAALSLISAIEPWSDLTEAILQGDSGAISWRIEFAPLPLPVNALYLPTLSGIPRVAVNDYLIGDSLEVTAAAIIEGILLESDQRSPNTASIAALMSTIAYAYFVDNNGEIVAETTWGTITRNIDLLALLNSSPWTGAAGTSDAVGFLSPASGAVDVLPGIALDAGSFQASVLNSARADGVDTVSLSIPSKLLLDVVESSGGAIWQSPAEAIIDQTAMIQFDSRVAGMLAPDTVASLISTLGLGIYL